MVSKLGSAKRFGPRYGGPLKHKLANVEARYRNFQRCPYCGRVKVKRLAAGIWNCRKCKTKFTGKAYSVD